MAPELDFAIEGAEAVSFCAEPTLALKLRVESAGAAPVQGVALDCQVRIEAQKRRYGSAEKERMVELFGLPGEWSRTLRSLLWTHARATVPPFSGTTRLDLPLPCSFDFNVIATKYFNGVEDGEVPLLLLFSGTIFYTGEQGELQVARIPWTKEAAYRLPVQVWKQVIDLYYPNQAWLCLRRDVVERLAAYKASRSLPTWEGALEALLQAAEATAPR